MGAFSEVASHLASLGLVPIPTGGIDGKQPLIRGYSRVRPGRETIATWGAKFPSANAALLTGASGLNVLDVDEPELLRPMLGRFGETPLIVRTAGRGGFQAYYRASEHVSPVDLRYTEGRAVEIKAGGNIVIAPPSVNPKTGRKYEYVEGRLDQATIATLPRLNETAIFQTRTAAEHRRITEGHRNTWLFSQLMRIAPHVDDFDALLDVARTRNDEAVPPLPDAEVEKTAHSAWRYQQDGRNFVTTRGGIVLSRERVESIVSADPGNAIALALFCETVHGARVQRGETFAMSRRAMAEAQTLPGWTEKQYRTGLERAVELGLLQRFDRPPGIPAQYTIPAISGGGPKTGPNVTNTPAPLSSQTPRALRREPRK